MAANSIKKTFLQLDRASGKFVKKVIHEIVNKPKLKGIGSGNSHKPMKHILIEKGNLQKGAIVSLTH